jgi:hypothetical protein
MNLNVLRVRIGDLPEDVEVAILESSEQDKSYLGRDSEISVKEALRRFLNWEGIIGYEDSVYCIFALACLPVKHPK